MKLAEKINITEIFLSDLERFKNSIAQKNYKDFSKSLDSMKSSIQQINAEDFFTFLSSSNSRGHDEVSRIYGCNQSGSGFDFERDMGRQMSVY